MSPGTLVACDTDTGGPLTISEIDERLTEVGVPEEDGDAGGREQISNPADWRFAERTCEYVGPLVDGLPEDGPKPGGGRHQWLLKQAVRLSCAWMLGCISEPDWRRAQKLLARRLVELRAATGQKVPRFETANAVKFGVQQTATKTEQQARAELGDHEHITGADGATSGEPAPGRAIALASITLAADGVPEWAWRHRDQGRIQRGTPTLFAGRPGAGKSTAARYFTAAYSRGELDGCWAGRPQNVAYIAAAEESLKYIVKPGLRAAGADLHRVYYPTVTSNGKQVQLLSLIDESALTTQLLAHNITVVVVDPVMSTINAKVDIHRNNETRAYFEPWARIAEAINGVVIAVVHLRKALGGDVVAAINGSSAFGEVARAVFAFAKDPESGEGTRIMSQVKNSAGFEDLSLAYLIEPAAVTTDTGDTAEVGKFTIVGDCERTVADIFSDPTQRPGTAIDEATDWLEDYLTQQGRTPSSDVKREAAKVGFSERTIKRAASKLRVVVESSGFPRRTYWTLPIGPQSPQEENSGPTGPTDGTEEQPRAREHYYQHKYSTDTSDHSRASGAKDFSWNDCGTTGTTVASANGQPPPPRCACGNEMLSPQSVARGHCERCHLSGKHQAGS